MRKLHQIGLALFLLIGVLPLGGCPATTTSAAVCPIAIVYPKDFMEDASKELMALEPDSRIAVMIEDYGRERLQLRALDKTAKH